MNKPSRIKYSIHFELAPKGGEKIYPIAKSFWEEIIAPFRDINNANYLIFQAHEGHLRKGRTK